MGDNFKNILSDKFKNHKPEVPAHLWSAISQNVGKEKEHNRGLILFVWGILTSTALCGMYLFNNYLQEQNLVSATRFHSKPNPTLPHGPKEIDSNNLTFGIPLRNEGIPSSDPVTATLPIVDTKKPDNKLSADAKTGADLVPNGASLQTKKTTSLIHKSGSSGAKNNHFSQRSPLGGSAEVHTLDPAKGLALGGQLMPTYQDTQLDKATMNLKASFQDTLAQDTVQKQEQLKEDLVVSEPQKKAKSNEKQQAFTHEAMLSFRPFKVFNLSGGIDQGHEITASYGRSLGKLKLHVGLSYTAFGTPLHYQVPENPQIEAAIDPSKNGNGFTDAQQDQNKPENHIVLTSLHTMGINMGIDYQNSFHKKWRFEAGIAMQPNFIMKSSHIDPSVDSKQIHNNKMGANNFKGVGINFKATTCMAYRPISRAELIFGVQTGYTPLSIHKTEKLRPFTIGPLFGLKWLF